MTLFYHAETRSFYDTAVHVADSIPPAAVKVTTAQKKKLLEGERTGQIIVLNNRGEPVLEALEPDPDAPTRLERSWRDSEIQRLTWLRDRHRDELELMRATTLRAEQYTQLLHYLQALRDWAQDEQFPDSGRRPDAPDWLNE